MTTTTTKSAVKSGRFGASLVLLLSIAALSACSSNNNAPAASDNAASGNTNTTNTTNATANQGDNAATNQSDAAAKPLVPVTQVTNWYAQPEHGGNYAALAEGFYKAAGLDMTIKPGVNVSGAQLLVSGKAQFAMSSSDEVLVARENGIPLVAVFGTFQKSPQSLTYHKDQNIKGMEDLNGRSVFVSSGISYWKYLTKKYDLSKSKEMKYNYELGSFMADDKSVVQSYITSEPYTLGQKGVDVGSLLIADYGYSPYANVMVTTESFLKEHPDEVQAFVTATMKGWNYYKDHYEEINPIIQKENPDVPLDAFAYSAKALQPLVYEGDAATHGVGYMTTERWQEMDDTLVDLGVTKKKQDVSAAFTNEFVEKALAEQ